VAKNRIQTGKSAETAAKVAEGIGEALARIVNRIESLDAEREKAYSQLLALQERLNVQAARFGKAVGEKVTTTAAAGRRMRERLGKKTSSAKKKRSGKKARIKIKCGVCGTPGHNARGHAKWQAARRK
jgi:hypothetical protein